MHRKLRLGTHIWGGLFLLVLAQIPGAATTLVFDGPQDVNGLDCDPANCVIGDRKEFQMFSASLTTPASPGGQWNLTLQTNYGVPLGGGGGGDVIPTFQYGRAFFAMCDFMITWNNIDYGIVMHAHDGYTAGNLYEVDGFKTSGQVMSAQLEDSPRPSMAVELQAGGHLRGVGTVTASANAGADGLTQALYEVQVAFTAPSNFLSSGLFKVRACSYACANGYISGDGEFPPVPGNDEGVPEPSTLAMMLVGAGALGVAKLRKRLS